MTTAIISQLREVQKLMHQSSEKENVLMTKADSSGSHIEVSQLYFETLGPLPRLSALKTRDTHDKLSVCVSAC